jgi:DNA replication regulator DPB11
MLITHQTEVLHNFLVNNGGEVLEASDVSAEDETPPILIVVSHKVTPEQRQQVRQVEMQLAYRCHVVNEWWVEKCLHQKELIEVQTPLCQPFTTFPLAGFEKLTICPSSFSGADLLHLSKAVPLLGEYLIPKFETVVDIYIGAQYDETLRPNTSVLICHESSALNREKLQYATEKSIPIVSLLWLADCIAEGRVLSFADYSISGKRQIGSNQNLFWHPVHNPRPIHRRLMRDNGQTMQGGNGGKVIEPRHEYRAKERNSTEPLQEIQPEVNSPKKQSLAKMKPRKNMPFDDEDDDDDEDGFVRIHHDQDETEDLGIRSIPDHDDQEEVEDSILKTFRDDEQYSLSISEAPPPTIPTIPRTNRVKPPPQFDGANDPQPTQARLTTAIITALLDSHKSKAARLLSRTTTTSSDGFVDLQPDSLDASAASVPDTTIPAPIIPLLRKHRTLGRAPSNPSSLSRNISGASNGSTTSLPALREQQDDLDALLHEQSSHDPDAGLFRPSQALSYEDPDAVASRKRVLASLGEEGKGEEAMGDGLKRRVEDIGVVKDRVRVVQEEGRGRRTRTARRKEGAV